MCVYYLYIVNIKYLNTIYMDLNLTSFLFYTISNERSMYSVFFFKTCDKNKSFILKLKLKKNI